MSPSGKMRSEQVVVSAPLSFAGSAQRIWQLTDQDAQAVKYGMMIVALVLISIAWMVVAAWYCIFGLFLVPYRMIRRGNRKDKVRAIQHREQLESLTAIQQQQTIQTANLIHQNKQPE
jgi:heme/copper-type cytochrome/quinol oxidase subunit 2